MITNSAKEEIGHMTQDDVVTVCGGANNISKNESTSGLKYVTQFVQNRRHTNVLIMNAPPRFDLVETSCVNEEVNVFNRKLKKIMVHHQTEVINISLNREHYMKHGPHMNGTGKVAYTQSSGHY